MGKHASRIKRGSASMQGPLGAPESGDWNFTGVTTTTITVQRLSTAPPGATGIWSRIRPPSLIWAAPVYVATVAGYTGLTTGTVYSFQVAWGTSTTQLSDFSSVKTQVTA